MTTKELLNKSKEETLTLGVELNVCAELPERVQWSDAIVLLKRARQVNTLLQELETSLRNGS